MIKVNFFNSDGNLDTKAISDGIYLIEIRPSKNEESIRALYIGESETIMVRCSEHLYKIFKNPSYMGLEKSDLENDKLELIFRVLEKGKASRKIREKEYIEELKPITQSGTSDRMLDSEKKYDAVQEVLQPYK